MVLSWRKAGIGRHSRRTMEGMGGKVNFNHRNFETFTGLPV